MDLDYREFLNNVYSFAKQLKLSPTALFAKAGLSAQCLANIKKQQGFPSVKTLYKLANTYNLPMDFFLLKRSKASSYIQVKLEEYEELIKIKQASEIFIKNIEIQPQL